MRMIDMFQVADQVYDHITIERTMNPRDCYGRFLFAIIQGCVGNDNPDSMGTQARHEFDNPPTSKRGFGKNETLRLCDKIAGSLSGDIQSTWVDEEGEEDDRTHLCTLASDVVFAFFESYNQTAGDVGVGDEKRVQLVCDIIRETYETMVAQITYRIGRNAL